MKYIVIGLGNFGKALCERLTDLGHEVIAVDENAEKVEMMKDSVSAAVCLNATDRNALSILPLKEADKVFVTIGEDFGESIHTIATLKQAGVKHLVGRAISQLHDAVLEAIGVDETIRPERGYAELYATRIEVPEALSSYIVGESYRILELTTPDALAGQQIGDIRLKDNFGLTLVTIKRAVDEKNVIGKHMLRMKVDTEFTDSTVLEKRDVLVLFGKLKDFRKLKDFSS